MRCITMKPLKMMKESQSQECEICFPWFLENNFQTQCHENILYELLQSLLDIYVYLLLKLLRFINPLLKYLVSWYWVMSCPTMVAWVLLYFLSHHGVCVAMLGMQSTGSTIDYNDIKLSRATVSRKCCVCFFMPATTKPEAADNLTRMDYNKHTIIFADSRIFKKQKNIRVSSRYFYKIYFRQRQIINRYKVK